MFKQAFVQIFYSLTWFIIWPFFKFFTRFQVHKPKNLVLKKPMILVANHLSLMDPFIIGICFLPFSEIHPLRFMVHDNWINQPFWGFFIKLWGGFPAYIGQGLEVSLKKPRQILKQGNNILMFPRGKRMQRFHKRKGKVGTSVLALTTNTMILPIKISDPYPKNLIKFFLRKRKLKIFIGQLFSLAEYFNKKENYTEADFKQGTEIIVKAISRLT